MSANTLIEWADDSVSFWWGCTHHGPGCLNCYAEKLSKRFGLDVWGPSSPRLWIPGAAAALRKLNDQAAREQRVRLVFINSMSDVFEENRGGLVYREGKELRAAWHGRTHAGVRVCKSGDMLIHRGGIGPGYQRATLDHLRGEIFAAADRCPWLRLLLLTKRPENIPPMWCSHGNPPSQLFRHKNVWLGTSISTQADAERNLPALLKCGDLSPVLFASYEPALEPVNFDQIAAPPALQRSFNGGLTYSALRANDERFYTAAHHLKWLIFGGESGTGARPCDVAWARSTVRQCRDAGVPCFVKQLGSHVIVRNDEVSDWLDDCGGTISTDAGPPRQGELIRARLRDSKGGDPAEWPTDIRVREFPEITPSVIAEA